MLAGINLWIKEARLKNALEAIELDVNAHWPQQSYQGAFAANIAHIMHLKEIEALFSGLDHVLTDKAVFCLYGPFNINGNYTSESNRRFDLWIKERDPDACIRDRNDLDQIAANNNFQPSTLWEMPSNNKILCWQKQGS